MLNLILLVLSLVLLVVQALGAAVPRVHLGWLGLAIYVLYVLLATT